MVKCSALNEIYTCPLYGSENSGNNVRVEDMEEDYKMPSSGQNTAILIMNSQHLWLLCIGLHKTDHVNSQP